MQTLFSLDSFCYTFVTDLLLCETLDRQSLESDRSRATLTRVMLLLDFIRATLLVGLRVMPIYPSHGTRLNKQR
jgi:hypothetical protein